MVEAIRRARGRFHGCGPVALSLVGWFVWMWFCFFFFIMRAFSKWALSTRWIVI